MGEYRELLIEGAYGAFETDVNRALGQGVRDSDYCAKLLWSALANIIWVHQERGYEVSYSFRAAGDLIAAIRQNGSYIDWYCSSDVARVEHGLEDRMRIMGWTWREATVND